MGSSHDPTKCYYDRQVQPNPQNPQFNKSVERLNREAGNDWGTCNLQTCHIVCLWTWEAPGSDWQVLLSVYLYSNKVWMWGGYGKIVNTSYTAIHCLQNMQDLAATCATSQTCASKVIFNMKTCMESDGVCHPSLGYRFTIVVRIYMSAMG